MTALRTPHTQPERSPGHWCHARCTRRTCDCPPCNCHECQTRAQHASTTRTHPPTTPRQQALDV